MTASLLRSGLHALALCAGLVSLHVQASGATSTDTPPSTTAEVRPVAWKDVPTQFVSAGGVDFAYRELGQIGELLQSERIRPVIDKVFPFEQAKEALDYLAQGRAKGKVVVRIR